jgi:hypothetical protein
MLAKEMPNARLVEADSIVELRLRPERLTNLIADFLDELWAGRAKARAQTRSSRGKAAGRRTKRD